MVSKMNNRLVCTKPYTWFEVTQVNGMGQVYLCCPAWLDTPIGNLRRSSVEEIWNGRKARRIRQSILDGSFKYCIRSRCAFLQTRTGPVRDLEEIEESEVRDAMKRGLTVLPYGPRQVICGYDRSCNLSCPSCRTEVIIETDRENQILEIQKKLQQQVLMDARYLYITGSGDPFGSPYFRRWLQGMEREQMPKLEEIRLHTNALLWNRKIWDSIRPEMRELIKSAEISIDAASEATYAVNRRPGKFSVLLENLEFIGSLLRNGPLKQVTISMVVQENNFREMPDFVRLGKRFGFDTVYFSRLVNYGTYSQEEFLQRAVHLPSHPRHAEFLDLLKEEILHEPIVHLGNLTELPA